MFRSLQEVEHERLSNHEMLKNEHIDLAVGRLTAMITSSRSDEAVTAVAPIVEAVVKITSLTNVEYLTIRSEEIDPSDLKRSNVEAAERAKPKAM